jgi:hypothetical protein
VQVYFAHAMSDYGNARERIALRAIAKHFPGAIIINPSRSGHAKAVQVMRTIRANVMDYFCALVRESDAVVYMETWDFKIGPGVAKEVLEAHVFQKPIHKVCPFTRTVGPAKVASNILTIAEMRERLADQSES